MKYANAKVDTYIDCSVENNKNNPKFKVGERMRKSEHKNIFAKGYTQNWFEEVKNTVPWTYLISDLNGEEIVGTFYEICYRRQARQNSGLKVLSKKMTLDCASNGRAMITHSRNGLT